MSSGLEAVIRLSSSLSVFTVRPSNYGSGVLMISRRYRRQDANVRVASGSRRDVPAVGADGEGDRSHWRMPSPLADVANAAGDDLPPRLPDFAAMAVTNASRPRRMAKLSYWTQLRDGLVAARGRPWPAARPRPPPARWACRRSPRQGGNWTRFSGCTGWCQAYRSRTLVRLLLCRNLQRRDHAVARAKKKVDCGNCRNDASTRSKTS